MKHIGIVGSRDWKNKNQIKEYIDSISEKVCIVSGGAKGVDSIAVQYAKEKGFEIKEYLPNIKECKYKYEFTKEYYKRNQQIVDASDELVAFVTKSTGGTWDTIRKAEKKNIPIKIIYQI